MGFWDALQFTTDKLKNWEPDLSSVKGGCQSSYGHMAAAASKVNSVVRGVGARDLLEKLKGGAPDIKPVKDVFWASYGYGRAAAGAVDHAVRVQTPQKVAEWMPDSDRRHRIARVLTVAGASATEIAVRESLRCLPGGPPLYGVIKGSGTEIYRIWNDKEAPTKPGPQSKHNDKETEIEEMKRKIERMEALLNCIQTQNLVLLEKVANKGSKASDAIPPVVAVAEAQSPLDVLRLYMLNEFRRGEFMDALLIPKVNAVRENQTRFSSEGL